MATKTRTRETPGALRYVPETRSLSVLREASQRCRGCDLYRHATQAVFGEMEGTGSNRETPRARLMMIGEQPGDREDKEGHPFVGPAGRLLDQCLEQAGIDRKTVYLTNVVKHFKWEPRGKLRIHKKPLSSEIFACGPWLEAELAAVHPDLIVCLGAIAAQALLGSKFKVTESMGPFSGRIRRNYRSRARLSWLLSILLRFCAPVLRMIAAGRRRHSLPIWERRRHF